MDPYLESVYGSTYAHKLVSFFGLELAKKAAPQRGDSIEPKRRRRNDETSETISDKFGSRDDRREQAQRFLKYVANQHASYPVIKACSWSGGSKVWSDTWLGLSCVSVHGIDSICVVVRDNDLLHLEQKLVESRGTDAIICFLELFWHFMVSEVEGIEERMFGQSSAQPFYVVTVDATGEEGEGVISGYEDSSDAIYRARQTSLFLQEKLESGVDLSSENTVQTAIMAVQHLFDKEFEAREIRVFVWDKNEIIGKELRHKRYDPDLEELLASMDGPESRRLGARRSHGTPSPPADLRTLLTGSEGMIMLVP